MKDSVKAGKALQGRQPTRRIKEAAVQRMPFSAAYQERRKAVQEAQRAREAELKAQRQAKSRSRERERVISRILSGTTGYEYWAVCKRTIGNYEIIEKVFLDHGIKVPSSDPISMNESLLIALHSSLEQYGFLVAFNPLVTVRACAALYWDIKLESGL
jgi:hypothetical protein